MTTVLFAHDGYMSLTNKGIYSDTYTNKIVERYLNIATNVVFLVRTRPCFGNDEKLNQIVVENFRVAGIENFKSLQGLLRYQAMIDKVKCEVQKADYIVARVPSDLGFLAAKYAGKYHKKYMVEVVGCPWDSLRNHSLLGKIIAPYYYFKQKKTVQNAPYALYVTKEFLQNRYPCRGISIGCSDVEIGNADETVLTKRIEKIKSTNVRSLVFGTLGTLHMKYKGYDTVIKALSKLNSEGYSHQYLIAGSGDPAWLSSVIHQYHADHFVTIVPPMEHEKVFEWLDNIDIYIQPSKTEGMPRALIEAMSRACPCIGSDAGGMPELLQTNSMFKKHDYKKLYDILKMNQAQLIRLSEVYFNTVKTYRRELLYEKKRVFYKLFSY
jgi:glycosyltransferase involved in cell wall biosynthesis